MTITPGKLKELRGLLDDVDPEELPFVFDEDIKGKYRHTAWTRDGVCISTSCVLSRIKLIVAAVNALPDLLDAAEACDTLLAWVKKTEDTVKKLRELAKEARGYNLPDFSYQTRRAAGSRFRAYNRAADLLEAALEQAEAAKEAQ